MDKNELRENVKNENINASESQDSKFEFITETIKAKPINKKKMFIKTIFTCFLGLLFGAIACATFVFLEPVLKELIYPENKTLQVKLSPDDEEIKANALSANESSDKTDTEDNEDSGALSANNAGETGNTEDIKTEEVRTEIITKVETIEKNLELEDYTALYQKISDVATEAKRAMVTVTGVSSDTDWFMNTYENNHTTSGLIVADNGKELLILARTSVIEASDSISVTFCNKECLEAVIKKSDSNTDLSILSVDLNKLSDDTKEVIKMAELGSTKNANLDGTPVIAIGDPLGVSDSIAIGQITSHADVKDMVDTNVNILTTDIYGSTDASGVLINFAGRVVGIVTSDVAASDTKNLIKGYAISDLKDKIEKISNGQEIAYLGIIGLDVTEEASEAYGVPMGAYVKQVVIDSPAMQSGIQNGDVIVKLGTSEIDSFQSFKEMMLKCQPGDLMMVTVKRPGPGGYTELSYEISLDKISY